MPLPPWVIEEREQERLRRTEEERVRSLRIELPQTPQSVESEHPQGTPRVRILEISPTDHALDNVIDV